MQYRCLDAFWSVDNYVDVCLYDVLLAKNCIRSLGILFTFVLIMNNIEVMILLSNYIEALGHHIKNIIKYDLFNDCKLIAILTKSGMRERAFFKYIFSKADFLHNILQLSSIPVT